MPKTKSRFRITVNDTFCKGCNLCVLICPRKGMELAPHMNERGIHPAHLAQPEVCTGCAQCALMCPDACITIVREDDASTDATE